MHEITGFHSNNTKSKGLKPRSPLRCTAVRIKITATVSLANRQELHWSKSLEKCFVSTVKETEERLTIDLIWSTWQLSGRCDELSRMSCDIITRVARKRNGQQNGVFRKTKYWLPVMMTHSGFLNFLLKRWKEKSYYTEKQPIRGNPILYQVRDQVCRLFEQYVVERGWS